jgi:tRNA threonylcarbamoyladenosine biosynthesis protein TsaE
VTAGERVAETSSAAETEAHAAAIAGTLGPGDVVLVSGELGAGKTTWVRGAARALGVRAPVTSPTFTIGSRYHGRIPVAHVDLYRLEHLETEDPGLLADYMTPDAITFVEWPERTTWSGTATLRIHIEHRGNDHRRITELTTDD